jgi:hypothetical protein
MWTAGRRSWSRWLDTADRTIAQPNCAGASGSDAQTFLRSVDPGRDRCLNARGLSGRPWRRMVCVRPQPDGLKQLPRPRRSVTVEAHVVRRARTLAVSEPSRRLGQALAATGLRGVGRRSSTVGRRRGPPIGDRCSSGGGLEGVVAGVAQRVVAAAHELAGHGDQGDVRLEALAELAVAGVVRRARAGRVETAASYNAQRSTGGPCLARWPRVRLPSEDLSSLEFGLAGDGGVGRAGSGRRRRRRR